MRDEIEFDLVVLLYLKRLFERHETDDLLHRQHMDATKIPIGIRRWETIQVRPADRGKEQRIGMEPGGGKDLFGYH